MVSGAGTPARIAFLLAGKPTGVSSAAVVLVSFTLLVIGAGVAPVIGLPAGLF